MKYKLYIIFFLSSYHVLAQQIAPSNNRSIAGLEKNMLFNAKSRFTVTQTGTATLDLPTLFDGKMAPSYTNTAPSVSNPTVVLIEDLLNAHVQAGAWVGWTTRYWAPKKFKIEGYNAYDNANIWVTVADVNNYTNFDFIQALPNGAFTKLRFTFYEGTGTNGLLGISELFFLHPEAVAAYDGFNLQIDQNENVSIPKSTSLEFGAGVAGKEGNAGKIAYKKFSDGLDIVGASATNGRKITFYAEAGSTFYGRVSVSSGNIQSIIASNEGGQLDLINSSKTGANSNVYSIFNMTGGYGNSLQIYSYPANGQPSCCTPRFKIFDVTGNTTLVPSGGNVGIGVDNPTEKLTVYGINNAQPGVLLLQSSREDLQNVEVGSIRAKNGEGEIARISLNREGGSSTGFLSFSTKATNSTALSESMRIAANGNVGVGTTNPQSKLQITGDNSIISITPNQEGQNRAINFMASTTVNAKYASIELNSTSGNLQFRSGSAGSGLGFSTSFFTDNIERMKINSIGQIIIGTPTVSTLPADYKLAVAGNIIAEKVKVKKSNTWPDFVFSLSYKLPNLTEVESFVKQNSHLPEIPSAKEIETEGQDLGEMNRLLLKKVEELTLYLIEQNKEIKSLKSKVELLEKK